MRGNRNRGVAILLILCFFVALGLAAGCGGKEGDASDFTVKAAVKGGHGEVRPEKQTVSSGQSASIDIQPDTGYAIASITDNGESMPIDVPYVIAGVDEDHYVEVIFKEGASQGPNGEEAFHADITSAVTYTEFAWTDSGAAEFIASPAKKSDDSSDADGGISGGGQTTLTGAGPMYSCSGTNQLTIGGYYAADRAYLTVDVSSNGTVVAGGMSRDFSSAYAYTLEFDMDEARSGGCTVTVPVESGTTTWVITSAGGTHATFRGQSSKFASTF